MSMKLRREQKRQLALSSQRPSRHSNYSTETPQPSPPVMRTANSKSTNPFDDNDKRGASNPFPNELYSDDMFDGISDDEHPPPPPPSPPPPPLPSFSPTNRTSTRGKPDPYEKRMERKERLSRQEQSRRQQQPYHVHADQKQHQQQQPKEEVGKDARSIHAELDDLRAQFDALRVIRETEAETHTRSKKRQEDPPMAVPTTNARKMDSNQGRPPGIPSGVDVHNMSTSEMRNLLATLQQKLPTALDHVVKEQNHAKTKNEDYSEHRENKIPEASHAKYSDRTKASETKEARRASEKSLTDVVERNSLFDKARLVLVYETVVNMLLRDIASLLSGDRILLNLYLLESGETSRRVVEELAEAAANRGVIVALSVDGSSNGGTGVYSGLFCPQILSDAKTLAKQIERFSFKMDFVNHSNFCIVHRGSVPTIGYFGALSLGDRFRGRTDFMMRVDGPEASGLAFHAPWGPSQVPTNAQNPDMCVVFVPSPSIYTNLAEDPNLIRYRIVVPYLTRAWGHLMRAALVRVMTTAATLSATAATKKVKVELLVAPKNANNPFYNVTMRTISELMYLPGTDFQVFRYPRNFQGCVMLGYDGGGPKVVSLGSFNHKRKYDMTEVNALSSAPFFVSAVHLAFVDLLCQAEQLTEPPVYSSSVAMTEDKRLG